MANALGFLTVVLAAGAKQQLCGGAPLRASLFEGLVTVKRADAGDWQAPVSIACGETVFTIEEWSAALRSRDARSAVLFDSAMLAATGDASPRTAAGFAGPSELLVGIESTDGSVTPVRASVGYPPRTLLTVGDILEFVESHPSRAALEQGLLRENELNLHYVEGNDWAQFASAVPLDAAPAVTETLSRVLSNVRFTNDERRAWQTLRESRRNPDSGPIFRYSEGPARSLPRIRDDLAHERSRLIDALGAIRAFATSNGASGWAELFGRNLALLEGRPLEGGPIVAALRSAGLREEQLRVAVAAFDSDVFGGMGSWNDQSFSNGSLYHNVSDELSMSVRAALEAAVNSFVP